MYTVVSTPYFPSCQKRVHGLDSRVMGHADPVTPEIRDAVFTRDRREVAEALANLGIISAWRGDRMVAYQSSRTVVVCSAVAIDADQYGWCLGRWSLDHIPDTMGVKMGMLIRGLTKAKRAPSDLSHLISLCEGHTEPGMKGGHQWNTANRPAIRDYLEQANA